MLYSFRLQRPEAFELLKAHAMSWWCRPAPLAEELVDAAVRRAVQKGASADDAVDPTLLLHLKHVAADSLFPELYQQRSTITRILRGKGYSPLDAEDAFQAAMMKVSALVTGPEARGLGHVQHNLRGFFYQICRNEAASAMRGQLPAPPGRHGNAPNPDEPRNELELLSPDEFFAELVERIEEAVAQREITRLQADTYIDHVVRGYTPTDIARKYDLNADTARQRVHDAIGRCGPIAQRIVDGRMKPPKGGSGESK